MIKYGLLVTLVASSLPLPAYYDQPLLPGARPSTKPSKYVDFREVGARLINGGVPSIIKGQLPHQAALYLYRPAGTAFCGGSLIGSTWILTAAQCTEDILGVAVYLGVVSLSDLSNGVMGTGVQVISHPSYSVNSFDNDIALVRLSTSIAFSIYVSPVLLATKPPEAGVNVTISGFGKLSGNATITNGVLSYASLTTINNVECNRYYGFPIGGICATGNNLQNFCSGDNGGPLIIGFGLGAVQVGISSFLPVWGCASEDYPSGFTSVAAYRDWIFSTANEY